MILSLTIGTFLSAAAYLWLAIYRESPRWKYALKPGTMLWILILAATGALENPGAYSWWILVGLLFSLAGDVFLMLPSDRFVQGLASFLIGHLCYITGIATLPPGVPDPLSMIMLGLMAAIAVVFSRLLGPGASREGGKNLRFAVTVYVSVISLMVWFALKTAQPLLITGAVIFAVSDAILGWNRFRRSLAWADYGVMSTYFTAQWFFALSIHMS
ncbi:lysoplasmalogenase [Salinithrix halophila]|uniref:Lysoplasmalogenase n=1 Tax=Salinithrix halophila TaxID=1485204 RepID=A0ABV8JCZ1_9BACL